MHAMKFAPRYDARLVRAIQQLADETVPIAEVCRRAGARAEELGVPRPSYGGVSRIVHAERAQKAQVRRADTAVDPGAGAGWVHDPVVGRSTTRRRLPRSQDGTA